MHYKPVLCGQNICTYTFELCAPTYIEDNSLLKMSYHIRRCLYIMGHAATVTTVFNTPWLAVDPGYYTSYP